MAPQTAPRTTGAPRPVSEPSSDKASAKPIEMPAPIAAASPTRNVAQVLWVAKAAANSGASVETEPSMRPARPGCTYCSTNMRRAVSSSAARALGRDLLAEFLGELLVLVLGGGEAREQIAHGVVVRRLGRAPVKPRRFEFHLLGEFAHRVEAERPVEPDRAARDEALDVLPADQRQKVAEFLAVEIEQHVVMLDLLLGHRVVHRRGVRVGAAQPVGERAVDAVVLVLVGDGERQDFLLAQIGKAFHGRLPRCRKNIRTLLN